MKPDLSKSLEQLENDYWGEPSYSSHLVVTCHKLRKIPLQELDPEGLRMLIGQNFNLDLLIPLAIEELKKNILVSGAFFEGDLLLSVLKSDPAYWRKHANLWQTVCHLFEQNLNLLSNPDYGQREKNEWLNKFERFRTIQ